MTFEQLQKEMINSMKSKNHMRKTVISDIISTAKNMAIAQGCKDNISKSIVQDAILKAKKTCQEQIDTCPASREDKLNEYKTRMNYIDEFAPKMMSEAEVRSFVENELIELTSVNIEISPKIKGMVMKNIMPKLKGKADGKLVNKVISELLKGE